LKSLELKEYELREGVRLTVEQRDLLRQLAPSISITPSIGTKDRYDLKPGSNIGALQLPDLEIHIRPKMPIKRVLFMLSYAMDPKAWTGQDVQFSEANTLVEAMAPPFLRATGYAFRRGLLHGYRTHEETSATVRGRIRFEAQMRRTLPMSPPAEVRYDDFTADIEENRLIKAAISRLRRMRLRSDWVARSLRRLGTDLAMLPDVRYHPGRLPEITFTRLNARYRGAIALAKLILSGASVELQTGETVGETLLFDMNRVFEDFVVAALREELCIGPRTLQQGATTPALYLDDEERTRLEPDLSWWEGHRCLFVGDLKYQTAGTSVQPGNLYQMLAYTIASELPTGLLIYASTAGAPEESNIGKARKQINLFGLDLDQEPSLVLGQLREIAACADRLAAEARVRTAA